MNERIRILGGLEVQIQRNASPDSRHYFKIFGDGHLSEGMGCDTPPFSWDADGRSALIDVLHCYRDTGSFAALADTSVGVFVGKVVRIKGEPHDDEYAVVDIIGNGAIGLRNTKTWWGLTRYAVDLLTLAAPPAPKVNCSALATAAKALEEFKEATLRNHQFETAAEAREAEYAVKKVMKRCGIIDP